MKTLLFSILVTSFLALPSSAAPLAWVSNERAGTVTVIDTATDKPVATIPAGDGAWGVAISPRQDLGTTSPHGATTWRNAVPTSSGAVEATP